MGKSKKMVKWAEQPGYIQFYIAVHQMWESTQKPVTTKDVVAYIRKQSGFCLAYTSATKYATYLARTGVLIVTTGARANKYAPCSELQQLGIVTSTIEYIRQEMRQIIRQKNKKAKYAATRKITQPTEPEKTTTNLLDQPTVKTENYLQNLCIAALAYIIQFKPEVDSHHFLGSKIESTLATVSVQ